MEQLKMKKTCLSSVLILFLLFSLFVFMGCGNDDNTVTGWGTAEPLPRVPFISSLAIYPTCAIINEGGGATTINIGFNVLDNDGDLKEAYITTYNEAGAVTNTFIVEYRDYFGKPKISTNAGIPFDTTIAGDFTVIIYVSDIAGNISNSLSGTFLITSLPDCPIPSPLSPTVFMPGYSISLLASGLGAATGIDISSTGDIFIADDNGNIFRVDNNTSQVQFYASNNLVHCQDVTFDEFGNLYVAADIGNPRTIYQVLGNDNYQAIASGDFTVGLKYFNGSLYLGNSGDGTITKVSPGGTTTFLSGYGGPHGPFGLTFDNSGNLYFVQHGTGQIWKSTPDGLTVTAVTTLSPLGPTFVAVDEIGNIFVSEPSTASIWKISNGIRTLFASGFSGGANPPYIGPNGLAIDNFGNLYVADAGNLWKISPP